MVLAGFSLLVLWSNLISELHISLTFGTIGIGLFVPAMVSFSGLSMAYKAIGNRYSYTHDLAWSLHSRFAMVGIALILSGIFAIMFRTVLY